MKPFSDNATPYPSWEYNDNIRVSIPFYESFHEETVDLVKTLKPEARVWLDTGCGTGYLVSRAFPHFPHTCFILADPSEGMLTQARHRLQQVQILIPPDRIRFLDPAGTEDLPRAVDPGEDLPDTIIRQPEVISAIQCHHYLKPEQRRTATQVCFNLLAQGGVYITFENIRPDSDQGVNLSLARWKRFQAHRPSRSCRRNR